MHLQTKRPLRRARGYALLLTLTFMGISLVFLASISRWTYTEAGITARNNLYTSAETAAESATEMVIAQMDRDFICQSISSDLTVYRNVTPNSVQSSWPQKFQFGNGSGGVNISGVISTGTAVVTNLNSQYQGLYGLVAPYRVTASAKALNQLYSPRATVSQDIQLVTIPVFQFAIFYNLELEINPGPAMVVTGKVHSNDKIYTAPGTSLEYKDSVTAVGNIIWDRDPNDPQYGSAKVNPLYDKQHTSKVSALSLPVSTDNSPASVQQILMPPPGSEDPNSELSKQRYYNKSDLIVKTTSSGVTVLTGKWNNFQPVAYDVTNAGIPGYSFLNTSRTFWDYREAKFTVTTELDVAALKTWITTPSKGSGINASVLSTTGHNLDSVYLDDQRTVSGKLTVIRVVNGASLPVDGLTVATRLPLYVKSHFNLNNGTDTTVGQTDTSHTKPASLVGDSITILSSSWNDAAYGSGTSLGSRGGANTTVNAAFIGGIVATAQVGGTKYYSGGVENFPRFLEDWGSSTLTYNGSMVVMFYSQYATSFWKGTGSGPNVYNPPTRKWAFDVNFLNQSKLPPGTPQVRKLNRGQWNVIAGS